MASPGQAQTYADSVGFYGDLGIAMGWNNLAGTFRPVDNGTMVGFSFGGGYRFNSWAAAEAEFVWVGGGEITKESDGSRVDGSLVSLGIAAKLYPMAFAPSVMPQWVQPHLSVGIGTGFAQFAPVAPFTFDAESRNVLLTRVGAGVDVMFTKHWGTTVDGSYYVTNNDTLTGIGVLKLGLLCRF